MSIKHACSWVVRSALVGLFAGSVAAAQVGCSVGPQEDASESGSAVSNATFEGVVRADGHATLTDPSGAIVFDSYVPASEIEVGAAPDGRPTFRFSDGSVVTRRSQESTPSGKTLHLLMADGTTTMTIRYREEGDASEGQIQPRILPLVIGGIVVIVGAGASYFAYRDCKDAYDRAADRCVKIGGVPSGGGCTNALIYWNFTPPECIVKRAALPTKREAVTNL